MSDSGKPGGVLATLPTTSDKDLWSPDESAAIEAAGLVFTFAYGEREGQKVLAPRAVVAQFLHLADRTGLDPLARQLYCIGRQGRDGVEWSIQTGIDGFRVVAERSKQYAGQDAAEWLTASGDWVEVWIKAVHGERGEDGKVLANAHPLAARVKVYRHDWTRPAVGVATWEEYVQTKRDGSPTKMWVERGPGQLAKCAEALSLRKAFPQDLSGLYTSDEIGDRASSAGEESQEPVRAAQKSRLAGSGASEAPVTPAEASDASVGRTEAPTRHLRRCKQCSLGNHAGCTMRLTSAADSPGCECDHGGEDIVDAEVVEETTSATGFPCAQCGREMALEEGQLCDECEQDVQDAIAAEQAAGQGKGA